MLWWAPVDNFKEFQVDMCCLFWVSDLVMFCYVTTNNLLFFYFCLVHCRSFSVQYRMQGLTLSLLLKMCGLMWEWRKQQKAASISYSDSRDISVLMYVWYEHSFSLYISFLQIIHLEYLIISLGINHASPKEEDTEMR